MAFRKIERSYHSTPFGWRLATFDEARNGLEKIKEQNLLNKWDRVRLLDGWITGPGYNFKMGNDFKGCLGYILLIRTEASGCAYADVNISDTQKEAALFLCADDWNYEVIYWLLNSWAKTDTMDLQDVKQGRIPFTDPAKFRQMNKVVCSLARKLGDNVPVSEKAAKRTYLGSHSGKEVLSNLIKIVNEEDLQQYDRSGFKTTAEVEESCFPRSLEPYWLEHLARQGGMDWNNIADVFWNFLSESFAGSMVEFCGNRILAQICKLNDESDGRTITSSQGNFIVASFILFYASSYLTDIMHASLAHDCWGSCAGKMLFYVASNSGSDDLPRFNQMLENNAMWRWYDQVGNYDLLNKLLVIAASGNVSRRLKTDEKNDILVVNMLLQCGAQPGSGYAILGCEKVTTLESAITFRDDEDIAKEVAKSLLHKCHREQQQQLANVPNKDGLTPLQFASWRGHALKCQMLVDHGARPDFLAKDNKTALHFASLLGHARVCQILLDNGARPDIQDTDGKTALHIAVEEKQNAVVNVLIKHPDITEVVDLKDKRGHSPLDAAVADTDMKLVATLLSKLRQPEAYFNKVDLNELLRYSLLNGCVYIVTKLFQKGTKLSVDECDDEGKTFVQLAAMGDDDSKAVDLVSILLENIEEKEKLVCNCDRIGRTALHEAALKGNEKLCRHLLDINPKIIDLKDRDGRNPLYDAVHGKQNEEAVLRMLLVEYSQKDIGLDDLRDRNGLTPLHVAASLGKKHLVKVLLSRSRNDSNQYFRGRDFLAQKASAFLKRGDFRGQTALHKAAICGDVETIGILLEEGAHPLNERDCDGRTALHYAFQAKTGGDKRTLANFLLASCNSYEEKSLLLWASPAGLGTADENLSKDDPIRKFLVDKKREITENMNTHNLLKTASSLGDTEMSKELVSLGYQIEDIYDEEWRERLEPTRRGNVEKVSRQLDIIPERGNDRPALSDDLERIDYARGLAALFLNPYLKPPITVGISGAWGMGKSSLLVQTEVILLTTAAQMALIPSSKLPSSALEFPDMKACQLSKKGKKKYNEIVRQINCRQEMRNIYEILSDKIRSWIKKSEESERPGENGYDEEKSLLHFLNHYEIKYHESFKSLAAMDRSDMFTRKRAQPIAKFPQNTDPLVNRNVPAVLTVQYNAWKYKNDTEALAGMAVEITKELEGIMTQAQWLSTCWRNTWKKKKYIIWIEFYFPCLLVLVLACSFTWIAWVVLDSEKFKEWANAKYAWPPAAMVIVVWKITKSVVGILKPVSTQLINYISLPDHTDKLGYQERVISDIQFLKGEIGEKPYSVFTAFVWVFNTLAVVWRLITKWSSALFFHSTCLERDIEVRNVAPASGTNLRIIVFVDDLDRCQESVILQVLSAINLVLSVCQISVVLAMDKELIQKAIIKKYGDVKHNKSMEARQELAEKYLQKIIQLPLDLPHPSEMQARRFLEVQMGKSSSRSKDYGSASQTYDKHKITSKLDDDRRKSSLLCRGEDLSQYAAGLEVTIDFQAQSEIAQINTVQTGKEARSQTEEDADTVDTRKEARSQKEEDPDTVHTRKEARSQKEEDAGNKKSSSFFINEIRDLLFVRYSQGEEDALCFFHTLTVDSRQFLPREWKVLLNYHGLVRNILCLNNEARNVFGWKVQLIAWICICWQWQENMNILIEKWNSVRKTSDSNGDSLLMLVDYFMENNLCDMSEMTKAISKEHHDKRQRASVKLVEPESNIAKIIDIAESSNRESRELKGVQGQKSNVINDDESKERLSLKELENVMKGQLETFEKRLDELKKEMKEMIEQATKYNGKIIKKKEEKKINLENWNKMRSALYKYDVSMDGIHAFQRFRFNCSAGHLW